MSKIVSTVKSWRGSRNVTPELSRSQYSLVSNLDLTAGAVQLWMGLPEEVKYDPALAPFRQFYEEEYDSISQKARNGSVPKNKRLPAVNSAPHLNNNLHIKIPRPADPGQIMARTRNYIKITLLLACWVFFTAVFIMYNERTVVTRNSSVAPGEIKSYVLETRNDDIRVMLKLSGPFLSEIGEKKLNDNEMNSSRNMEIWLERWLVPDKRVSEKHHILLQEEDLDFSEGEKRSIFLTLKSNGLNDSGTYVLRMRTDANQTTPFAMNYKIDPLDVSTGVIYAALLLCGLYVIIIFEVINRTMAAILLSTTSLAALTLAGERPSLSEVISWIDVETLLLLFSMMLLVAIMAETGMFDFLAVFTFEVTKGKLWPLISLLCAITAVLSTFLDNVTTVLLMTPVTIRLCEVMELDPIPVLMSMVLYSNIGGTATPVGDPPNVIIASNKAVIEAGVNFTNFTLHMTLGVLFVCIQTYLQLRFIYRDVRKLRLNEPRDILELRRQISIWRRATESLPQLSKDQVVVKERLEKKIKKLSAELDFMIKESKIRGCPKETFQSTLQEMKEKYKIRDKALLVKSTVAISFVVVVFFLHSIPELKRVSLGWTALLGAILLLTLADRDDLEPILHRVEWSTLLFFAALFVLMEALSKLGLIEFIGGLTESIILQVDESARLAVAILLMLWVSGLTSAFVDNIPLTTMMVRVVTSLGSNPDLNLPMTPLIWALSFGACLGGNGTLIGASANVVCAGVAEQHGYKFTFVQFFKIGFPIMIGHLVLVCYKLNCDKKNHLKRMIVETIVSKVKESQYSLVSVGEVTEAALRAWGGLPHEVRDDPTWAPFHQLYEKKHGTLQTPQHHRNDSEIKVKRLPAVNSAPVLAEDIEYRSKKPEIVEEAKKKEQETDKVSITSTKQKVYKAKYYTKMTILLACWMFFTVIFLTYNEKEDLSIITSVAGGDDRNFTLPNPNTSDFSVLVKLKGPFLSDNTEIKLNDTEHYRLPKMNIWLERWGAVGNNSTLEGISEAWTLILQEYSGFNDGELRENRLKIKGNSSDRFLIRMNTTSSYTTAFVLSYQINPLDSAIGVIYACVLLCGLYILIIFEVINRTMAAITVSTMSLAALALAGERPTLPEVISWLDVETLLLLFSMMLLVAIMAETGIFDFLAVFTFEVTKGKLWPLIYLLCIITAVLSTFLDNVTTVLLMSPVTIRLCEVMDLDPVPILMFMAIYSNIGGTATPVGDPPNVIVASNKAVIQAGINFTNFTAHMALGILLVCVQTSLQIKYIYRDSNKLRLAVPREIQDLTQQISIWRRAAESLPHLSRDVQVVRERLERKIRKLSLQLENCVKENKKRACPKETFHSTLVELKDKYKIRDKALLIKASVAIAFVVIVFFLHSIPEFNRVSLGWTALLGAILLLTLADREDLEPILHRVEWSTLLFFASLFVLMEALSKLGLIVYIGSLMEMLILRVGENARLAVALMLILWISGMISAFVDNIPLTTMMVRVVISIGSNPHLNLPMAPLIWALLYGACLGGNGTLIGASANVVCAGVAEQHGYKFTFTRFFKVGFPVMIGHLFTASVYLLLCHCVFEWH
ncbi:hypothetical protein K1T71_000948 [Dendrolimus kikuchii]|uniref:Uncharacterized protein n=1 Tax=Dendrolimus kikuchii TaxID=765133 RepID=A0ACC1DGG1_9NEOP|nr:hypothetical protein K1T71_000948 [Dendrolimus kikuchii]